MKLGKIGAYVRQPTTLIAVALTLGTGIAAWFGALPESASVALLAAAVPLLISDNSSALSKAFSDRDALAGLVHALTTHENIGPEATKIVAGAVPGGALIAAAASALVAQQEAQSTAKKAAGNTGAALLLLCVVSTGLVACSPDQRAQGVYALNQSYVSASRVAVAYEKDPAADPAVVSKIKSSFITAHDQIAPLVKAAKAGDPLTQAEIEAAQDAFGAASALLPTH